MKTQAKRLAADIGLTRKEVHEARIIRDAENVLAALEAVAPTLSPEERTRCFKALAAGGRPSVDDDGDLLAMTELLKRRHAKRPTDAARKVLELRREYAGKNSASVRRLVRKYNQNLF